MAIDYDKLLKARISQSSDFKSNWDAIQYRFIPADGEIIVYKDFKVTLVHNDSTGEDEPTYTPAIKIGNGMDYLGDLKYLSQDEMESLNSHLANTEIHVTREDKEFWNNKLNYDLDESRLIFNRN